MKPNFFIIGAPKSGTTALASYLSEHPKVFITDPKEPHYYSSDLAHGSYKNSQKYLSLFEQAGLSCSAVGEASVWYLYSKEAVKNILSDVHGAKFIVMLRNPVGMAPSLHEQMVFTGYETEKDFSRAWELQEPRRAGHKIPFWCDEPKLLLYKDACSIGEQYERARQLIPKGHLLPIIFDDFKTSPRKVWLEVMRFLGVEDDKRVSFPVVNSAKERRSYLLKKVSDVYCKTRSAIGFQGFGSGLFAKIGAWNIKNRPRPSLNSYSLAKLKSAFSDDIDRLEKSLGRDLSEWRE